MVIQGIQEVAQYIEVKFRITLQWMDTMVLYYNIKAEEELNSLTMDEQLALWTPTIVFWNTKDQLRTLNDKITFASIKRDGNGSIIDQEVNEDIELFQGLENPISMIMIRVYSTQFYCEYNMRWYLFDQQTCHVEMIMDGVLNNYADLLPRVLNFTSSKELTQYFIKNYQIGNKKI